MSVFLSERIRDVKGWIPSEDIDGLDVFRAQYCRDAENIDFENGFMRNVKKPTKVNYPSGVSDLLTGDWKVISTQFYTHEIRGLTWFYMLREPTSGALKFVVTDSTLTNGVELQIFDDNITPPTDEPIEVNYMIVDNQLKINLNIISEYTNTEATDIYMNLTLVYLDEQSNAGTALDRDAGWYLTPRWLGWSYFDSTTDYQDLNPSNIVITKDNFTSYTNSGVTVSGVNMQFDVGGYVSVPATKSLGGVIIFQVTGGAGDLLEIFVSNGTPAGAPDEYYIRTSYEPNAVNNGNYENDWSYLFGPAFGSDTHLTVRAHSDNGGVLIVNKITFKPFDGENVLLSIAEDGQVIPIRSYTAFNGGFPIEDWQVLVTPTAGWDYRIDFNNLWVYADDGTGILKAYEVLVNDITEVGDNVELELRIATTYEEHPLVGAPTTLNFTYGLGAQIRPFHEELELVEVIYRGDYIYSEVTYKGREYYVRDNNKLYLSHISGSGKLQPDSFPYDLELEFGFLRSDYEFEVLKALVITPLDELMVSGIQDNLVYTIQSGQTMVYRRIKSLNGIVGLSSRQSLLRSAKGTGIAKGLFWVNDEGIYWHGGGIREPERINEIKLRHYWQTQIDSNTVITMYDAYKKEILFANDKNIIVFDIVTAEWKPYKFDTGVNQFIGILNNIPYFLGDDNLIYKIDPAGTTYFQGNFTTHDTTNYQIGKDDKPAPMSELDDKIMQEVYSSVTNKIAGAIIIDIYADDNLIDGSILLSSTVTFQTCWTWLLIRYKRMRIKVWITPTNIELREVGFTFSIPTQAPATSVATKEGGFGFDFGKFYGE